MIMNKILFAGSTAVATCLCLCACGQAPTPAATSLPATGAEFTDMQMHGEDAVKFASLLHNCGVSVDAATQSTKADALRCDVEIPPLTGQSCTLITGDSKQIVKGARAARLLSMMVKYRIFHRAGMNGGGTGEIKGIKCHPMGSCVFLI